MLPAPETIARPKIKIQNILYTTDFSACSESAAAYATGIARQFGSAVHVLHVLSREPVVVGEYGVHISELDANLQADVAKKLDRLCKSYFEGIQCSQTIRIADPADVGNIVQELVARMGIDLIVMGTHGRVGLKHLLLGSVAEQVFRIASCPVLTIRPEMEKSGLVGGRFDRILYATDFSPASGAALQYALFFANMFNSQVMLLHALHSDDVAETFDRLVAQTTDRLASLIPADAGIKYSVLARRALPADLILEVSKSWRANLIVIGAHHGSSISAHSPWAIAHQVMCQAPCPVFTAHEVAAAQTRMAIAS